MHTVALHLALCIFFRIKNRKNNVCVTYVHVTRIQNERDEPFYKSPLPYWERVCEVVRK